MRQKSLKEIIAIRLSATQPSAIDPQLERRIREMAARWEYAPDELAMALQGAASDPTAWLSWVIWDETWTGGGSNPFRMH